MNKVAVCFTNSGKQVIEKLNEAAIEAGIEPWQAYCSADSIKADVFTRIPELHAWTGKQFQEKNTILFVGATGIAVRAIAPHVEDKLTDSPVLVTDDQGRFVIPLLSGHAGGANKLAVVVAKLLDAIPVITTATDAHGVFSADVFAAECGLSIKNREGIKTVSAKAIEGKNITISIKDFPPKEKTDIVIADACDREYDLLLSPKRYTLGIGTKKDIPFEQLETFILRFLEEHEIATEDIYALCTIDRKEKEEGILRFCDKYRIPLLTFEASLLKKAEGDFEDSDFVQKTVGVGNVCERAAVLGAGMGKTVVKKTAESGITLALAERNKHV
ncbi:MAG: cobalamin biosynthesis protein [Lachnospiraceae bacterium]|nr:cobalamin biosynthesis protein [Lachnospiraceae bacterium]